jgi:uncharacterized protein (TIGR02680 family)
MTGVTARWRLNRAGITNVYQYVDETLHFGGGRLLLRGVNGSGKSTAMNMLLPFLLEADTRRIDAAGEQASVLKSWMLTGRDEQQPVGYLWIEFERTGPTGDPEHRVCGCGIKVNRSTDRVTTWWFITPKRPGIDVSLVQHRTPLSADALRELLGPHAVFADSARPAYRQAVRTELFGGRDIDQHIRLLHVVRNPRVGDRIDTELTDYLADSLPQLSDDAIDDAAQPLEDLDEHRRNVHDLGRTADSLRALTEVYAAYIAGDLRERASELLGLCAEVNRAQRRAATTRSAAITAADEEAGRQNEITTLAADEERLRNEISAFEMLPAYQQGLGLDQLRATVAALARAVASAEWHVRTAAADLARRKAAASDRSADVAREHGRARDALATLAALARGCGLPTAAPSLPPAATDELPVDCFLVEDAVVVLERIRSDARDRTHDVAEVTAALDQLEERTRELVSAERARTKALTARDESNARLAAARARHADAVDAWRGAVVAWVDRVRSVHPAAPLDPTALDRPDLADAALEVHHSMQLTAHDLVDADTRALEAATRVHTEAVLAVAALQDELDELGLSTHPDPPSAAWQRAGERLRLADCIDFADHVDDDARRGLEAALEAAGLLGAETNGDGAIVLATGELVAVGGPAAERSLLDLLTVTIPEGRSGDVTTEQVTAVLAAISVDPDAGHPTWVSTNGTFAVGSLRGRHEKAVAEHIGVTARRRAIERRRAELGVQLDVARRLAERCAHDVADVEARRTLTVRLRDQLPSTSPISAAAHAVDAADAELARREEELDRADLDVAAADAARATAADTSDRIAFTHQLPTDRAALAEVTEQLRDVDRGIHTVITGLSTVRAAHGVWAAAVGDVHEAAAKHADAIAALDIARLAHEPEAMQLATLEDSIGTEYAELLAALDLSRRDLATTKASLESARAGLAAAIRAAASAAAEADAADSALASAGSRCLAALPPMRTALAVPGVVDSIEGLREAAEQIVDETIAGVDALGRAVLRAVPEPARVVTADGVRNSIKQRRDQLGAGWDVEDHQPDPRKPITVQVTGPAGRTELPAASRQVAENLAQQAGLLTAKQDQALRNLLQGRVANEVAEKMHAATELVGLMNRRLEQIATAHGIGVRLSWKRSSTLAPELDEMVDLLARTPELRTADHDARLSELLAARIDDGRRSDPDRRYRDLIASLFDYRLWHEMGVLVVRPGRSPERLTRRTQLSEGEKKIVSYLPLFAAVAASYDAIAESAPAVPRFLLLDDAFAKVSEDNHAQLFGLLVELDLDFIATSERLWGTHSTVPELAITEVLRDAGLGVIVLEHSRWDGRRRAEVR